MRDEYFGIVRVGDILNKLVDFVDWVGIVVVALAVADCCSRTWKHQFIVVVPGCGNQRDNFPEQFVLRETYPFCFRLVLNLLHGLVFPVAGDTLRVVDSLASDFEVRGQVFISIH